MSKESKYLWILDNGHGGLINGVYQTAGKRSPIFPDKSVLYEGEFNRWVVTRLAQLLTQKEIKHVNLVPEQLDTSLSTRVNKANMLHAEHKKTSPIADSIYLSVHANAFGSAWNDANGTETYHFSVNNKSIAQVFQKALIQELKLKDRGVKTADFYVLKHTNMKAILTETAFMTNLKEATLMKDLNFREKVAQAHFKAILTIEGQI